MHSSLATAPVQLGDEGDELLPEDTMNFDRVMGKVALQAEAANRYKTQRGLHWMKKEEDPKAPIYSALDGAHTKLRIIKALVLVATYKHPEESAGGIAMAGTKLDREDEYQGRAGLVLALGPLAFQDDASIKWGGVVPKVGDWVVYTASAGTATSLMGVHCRFIEDVNIDSITDDPTIVF